MNILNITCVKTLFSLEKTVAIRGIAITLIIFSHVIGCLGVRYATPLGGIGVAIFLILSGYGLKESYDKKGLSFFWKNKFLNVYIPYLIVELLLFFRFGDFDILSLLLLKPRVSYFWYLNFLLVNYLIFFVLYLKSWHKYDNFILLIISCLFFFYCGELRAEQCFSFTLGVFLSKYKYRFQRYINKCTIFYCFLIGFIALYIKQIEWCRTGNYYVFIFMQVLNKIPLGLSIMFLSIFFKKYTLWSYIGKYSYELYLTHVLFIPILIVDLSLSSILIYIIFFISSAFFIFRIKKDIISLIKY